MQSIKFTIKSPPKTLNIRVSVNDKCIYEFKETQSISITFRDHFKNTLQRNSSEFSIGLRKHLLFLFGQDRDFFSNFFVFGQRFKIDITVILENASPMTPKPHVFNLKNIIPDEFFKDQDANEYLLSRKIMFEIAEALTYSDDMVFLRKAA